jgi:hypothetical protein
MFLFTWEIPGYVPKLQPSSSLPPSPSTTSETFDERPQWLLFLRFVQVMNLEGIPNESAYKSA